MATPTSTVATAPTGSDGRLLWPDVAKGLCILLVVLHHLTTKHYLGLVPATEGWLADTWTAVTLALKPVRMPLFFVLSGFFAASAVGRPWSQVSRRVTSPYYLYVVWLLVLGGVFTVERSLVMNRTQDLGELLADLVFASTGLWFLYALAVYFLLARLLLRVPLPLALGLAGTVTAAAYAFPLEDANRTSVLVHFTWFLAGSRCPRLVRRLGGLEVPGMLSLLVVGYAVLLTVPGVPTLLLSVVGVPLGLVAAGALARGSRCAPVLGRLGRRTLPVYVLHMPLLAILHHALVGPAPVGGVDDLLVLAAYPVMLSVVLVLACLGVHALLVRLGLGLLFELPRPLAGAGVGSEPADRRGDQHGDLVGGLGGLQRRAEARLHAGAGELREHLQVARRILVRRGDQQRDRDRGLVLVEGQRLGQPRHGDGQLVDRGAAGVGDGQAAGQGRRLELLAGQDGLDERVRVADPSRVREQSGEGPDDAADTLAGGAVEGHDGGHGDGRGWGAHGLIVPAGSQTSSAGPGPSRAPVRGPAAPAVRPRVPRLPPRRGGAAGSRRAGRRAR
jgi:uncharacterized membrane protein YcfT